MPGRWASNRTRASSESAIPGADRQPMVIALVIVAVAYGLVFAVSPFAALLVVTDGLGAGGILLAATLAGTWCTARGTWKHVPLRWHLLAGAVVGIGGTAMLVLVFGTLSLLHRPLWIVLLCILAVLGIGRLPALWRMRQQKTSDPSTPAPPSWVWMMAAPFLALALLSATTPPGILWQEEANGYDVLEYHLGVPKEYFEQGKIEFLPHNVYSNFPSNYEMFALLSMILWDSPHDAVFMAKQFNVGFGALVVFAAWCVGRDIHPRVGTLTGVLAAGCPWLGYFSGIAFVENGMLFMTMAAMAFAIRALRSDDETQRWQNAIFSGLAAGFAGGFKYTALPMLALPLLGIFLIDSAGKWPKRWICWRSPLLFGVCTVGAVSPWLIKNVVATGNPVFPLAARIFPVSEDLWPAHLVERWRQGHRPLPEESNLSARLGLLGSRVLADGRFGPVLVMLALPAVFLATASRLTRYLLLLLVIQLSVWTSVTHLYARFAVPIIPTLLALAALTLDAVRRRFSSAYAQRAGVLLVFAASTPHLYLLGGLYYHHAFPDGRPAPIHLPPDAFVQGMVPGTEYVGALNDRLGPDDKALLVGEARHFYINRPVSYAVVFSPNPFLETVERYADTDGGAARIVAWLGENGFTHLYVGWSEVARLAKTYGFSEKIRPDLFADLQTAGLKPLESFYWPTHAQPYGQLYEVPHR